MSVLIERLRSALGAEYDVERELAAGGMGIVFLGRERALDRAVAIKILRPELATAVAAERFQREARMLAAVTHPSIVTIHRVGEADGLFYFVMERLPGTLADRLARGPLPPLQVVRIAGDLLAGLARIHDRDIVHRDIKPANIFLRDDGRAVLGDFGIARSVLRSDGGLTATGQYVGTPDYMAPEQFTQADVGPAADLYTMGMVCYEALTGRRWRGGDPADGDWTAVPGRLRAVLQGALARDPASRWGDARAFSRALAATQGPTGRTWVVAAAAAVVLGVVLLWLPARAPPTEPGSDVAVLPLTVEGGSPEVGEALAIWIEANLTRAFGDSGLRVTPTALTRPWAIQRDATGLLAASAWDELHTDRILRGRVTLAGDSMAAVVELLDREGRVVPLTRVAGTAAEQMALGHRLALAVVRAVRPNRAAMFVGFRTGGNVTAVEALVAGEHAFQRDNWAAAEAFYQRAIELDSSLALAQWGLYNVRRWRRANPDVSALAAVYARHAESFVGVDQLLVEADLASTVPERLAILQDAIERYPYDPYPRLMLGNEMFHRGALADFGLDSAVAALRRAATANPYVASTYSMLAWALTRLGDREGARAALTTHAEMARAQPEADFCMQCVLNLAWAERFLAPADAGRARAELLTSPDGMASLARAVRLGLSFGLPDAQAGIGEQLAMHPDPGARTIGFAAQALARLAQGRVAAALGHLEAAGGVTDDPEFAFQAAQWRVVLPALGVPGVTDVERSTGRAHLVERANEPRFAARAQWTLLLHALAGASPEVEEHWRALDALPAPRLRALGLALVTAARGDTAAALALTDSLRPHVLAAEVTDPLQRAVLFLHRGYWLAGRDPDAADRAWRWYENADLLGWPDGYPQAAELDWSLETFARHARARLARETGHGARACALLPDAMMRWGQADSAYASLRRDLTAWKAECQVS